MGRQRRLRAGGVLCKMGQPYRESAYRKKAHVNYTNRQSKYVKSKNIQDPSPNGGASYKDSGPRRPESGARRSADTVPGAVRRDETIAQWLNRQKEAV